MPKYARLSPLWWNWFQPAWEEGLVFIPDQLIIPFSAPISNSGKLPHLISRSVSSMPDSLPTINKDSLVHLLTLFFLPQFPFVLIRLWGPFFKWGISMSLQSGASHRSRVIFPDCQIYNFHFFFFFFQAWQLFHDITHFLKQNIFLPLFPIVLVTNLVTPLTCQHLPNLISGHCQKFFSQNFNFFQFSAIIFGCSTFWLTLHVLP